MRILVFISVFVLLCQPVYSHLRDHLKKFDIDSEVHSIKNIDFIYMINLDQRVERWERCCNELNTYGIRPFRFSAVNGWELSLETIQEVGLKFSPEMHQGMIGTSYLEDDFQPIHDYLVNYGQTYFCHCLSRGAIGIALSHLSLLQHAWDHHYETIWIMEDDIEILDNPLTLSSVIDQLDNLVGKENWDVLFTDRDMRDFEGNYKPCYWSAERPDRPSSLSENFAKRIKVSEDFWRIGARYGTHSMIIRRQGIKKLLTYFHSYKIFLPYDLDLIHPSGINLYTTDKDIVSNFPKAASDNGAPNYLQGNI